MNSPEKEPGNAEFGNNTSDHPVIELMHVGERMVNRTGEYIAETHEDAAHLARVVARCTPEYSREAVLEIKKILGKGTGKTVDKEQ